MLKNLSCRLLDLLYPGQCHFCHCPLQGANYLCESCDLSLARVEAPFCESCGEPFDGLITQQFTCPNCTGVDHAFDFAIAALRHSEKNRDLVHSLKYKRQRYLSRTIAMLMAEKFAEDKRFLNQRWVLVPTPLHWSRRIQRHFNQSKDIAVMLGKELEIPVKYLLKRKRRTPTQTRLNRASRLKNLKGAFSCRRGIEQMGALNIILIDDVLTTGSTAHECAKTLKQVENVEKVIVLTLLRG